MTLNPLQQTACDGLLEFVREKQHSFALLLGPAGSGKTYTVSHVIREVLASDREVVVATPTHKAKRVLLNALAKHGIDAPAMTVSSLIGKAPSSSDDPDEEGAAKWLYGGGGAIPPNSLLLVDEVSMVDFKEMKLIKKVVESHHAQCILCGDFSQLRPVKGQSIVDAVEKIPVRFMLNEVMRSGSKGIVGISKAVRTTGQIDLDCVDNEAVFLHHSSDKFEQEFVKTPEAVAIAYTNKRVSELNHIKRRAIYGDDVADFMPDESVILTESPYFIRGRGSMSGNFENIKVADNNDQLIVKHVGFRAEENHPFAKDKVSYYDLSLLNPETMLEFEAKGLTYDMYVNNLKPVMDDILANLRAFTDKLAKIDQELNKRFERGGIDKTKKYHITPQQAEKFFNPQQFAWIQKTTFTNPKFLGRAFSFSDDSESIYPVKGSWSTLKSLCWSRDYFGFKQQFAVLLYEHATTAHKSQGSTYKHAYIDLPNLQTIRDSEDRQAATYVAVSRASETLHIRI